MTRQGWAAPIEAIVRLLRHQRQGIRRVTGTDDVRRCPSRSTSTLRALNSSRWCRTQPPTTWCDNARCDEEPRASAPSPSPLITRGHPIRPTHGFITIDCIAQGPRVLPPRYSSIVSLKGISATALPVSSDYEPPPFGATPRRTFSLISSRALVAASWRTSSRSASSTPWEPTMVRSSSTMLKK
jgi:hypothetical protein